MNERLAAENAQLMAELAKWQAGRHPAQKAAYSSAGMGASSNTSGGNGGVCIAGGSESSMPVKEAVALAVKEALLAGRADVLPALLTNNVSGTAGAAAGWTASMSSRLEAALSAAAINMMLRSKVR